MRPRSPLLVSRAAWVGPRAALRCALALTLFACGGDDPAPPAPPLPPPSPTVTPTDLLLDADARTLTDRLEGHAFEGEAPLRAAAVRGIANLHEAETFPLLARSLRDTDPAVRDAAALGIGALGLDAPPTATAVLTGAMAAEEDPALRRLMVRDLGRLATEEALPVLEAVLDGDDAAARAQACLGLAERGILGRAVPSQTVRRMASMITPGEPVEVRVACAYALGRVPPPTDSAGQETMGIGLGLALVDPDPEVRRFAARALAALPQSDLARLVNATRDPDWQVAVQAHRSVAARLALTDDAAAPTAVLLRAASNDLFDEEGEVRPGGPLHIFLTAIEGAGPQARAGPVHDLAAELHDRLKPRDTVSRDRALAHCAAAGLMDRGRGWPSRIERCGGDAVTPAEREVMEAQILGDLDGAEAQRMVRLRRLFARETPQVREAVVAAAAKIMLAEAITLILEGVRVDDAGVRPAALRALAEVARRRPTAEVVPPPVPVDAALAALAIARAATPDGELETLVTWIDAVEALDGRRFAPELRVLAVHPNHAVRHAARRLLGTFGAPLPEGEVPSAEPVVDPASLPSAAHHPVVELLTRRGSIRVALRSDLAPTTVARFLELVRAGFYDGLTFHRVVAAFVVQGGDPRADGYGGPGWSQRCEDQRLPFERGTLGMALAGRDTGGSQFFITLGRQPHLDGRYTAFGQVTDGLELIDLLQAGDPIERVTVVSN